MMSDSVDVAITTANSILIITCIVGNCFVCAVVLRNRDMRIPFNYLLVNLAATDICYAAFYVPIIILSHRVNHPEGLAGTVLCTVLTGGNLSWIGGRASMVTLLVIAIERYFAVVHPHGNKGKLTNRKLKVIIPGIWIIAIIYRLPSAKRSFVASSHSCVSSLPAETKKATGIAFRALKFFLIALLLVLYSRVVYALWFKRSGVALSHQQQGVLRLRKRVTLMVVTVSAIFAISWGGDAILHNLKDNSIKLNPLVIPIAHVIITFNAAVNPFAYALLNERFRKKMKEMMCSGSRSFATKADVISGREPQGIQMASNTGSIPETQQEQMSNRLETIPQDNERPQ